MLALPAGVAADRLRFKRGDSVSLSAGAGGPLESDRVLYGGVTELEGGTLVSRVAVPYPRPHLVVTHRIHFPPFISNSFSALKARKVGE